MTHSRRQFLRTSAYAAAFLPAGSFHSPQNVEAIHSALYRRSDTSPGVISEDEEFWRVVQQGYNQSPEFINLESGYYSPSSISVLQSRIRHIQEINQAPSYYMRRKMAADKEAVRTRLAEFAGADPEEIALVRNTTEALNIVIQGLKLPEGSEILYCEREYPSMKEALEHSARRYGIRLKMINVPYLPDGTNEVVDLYERSISPATRAILVSHMIYLTGQILPVQQIASMARARGIEVIIDAAHSFAHLDYKVPDLNGDFAGTSLHKWLGVPLGAGMLHVRRDKIERVWPLFGDVAYAENDIRKFEHIGTHPVATHLSILDAIDFHEAVGGKRKEARLRYLKDYWVDQVADLSGVTINTPRSAEQSCAIANVMVEGTTPNELVEILLDRYGIFTVAVDSGARIAPNLWTTTGHLDTLVKSITEISRSG